MRLITSIVISMSALFSLAQSMMPIQHDTLQLDQELIVSGVADFSSTSLQNELMQKLFYGGEITFGIKNRSLIDHKGINRFGADISCEVEYRNLKLNLFKNPNWGLTVKSGYYNYVSLLYSKDLYGLTFFGNDNYLGQNVNLSGTRFLGMSFQKFGFGVVDKKSKSSVSFNVYSLSNYAEATVYDGNLFQSASADSVSLSMHGNFDFSNGESFVKGMGAGVDLDFRLPVMFREGKTSFIQFQAKNLGICSFQKNITRYSADTTIHFTGLTFDQIIGENAIFNKNFSLMDSLGVDSLGIRKWRFLPCFIQVGKIVDEMDSSRVQSFYGIRMYSTSAFVPMIYGGLHYRLTNAFGLGMNLSFGGYSNTRFGIYAQCQFGNLSAGIASENLTGIFLKGAKGESILIRLRCKF